MSDKQSEPRIYRVTEEQFAQMLTIAKLYAKVYPYPQSTPKEK